MNYYVIKIPSDKKNAYCVESPCFESDDHLPGNFRKGIKIDYPVSDLKVKTDKDHGRIFHDAIPSQGLEFIISDKLLGVLNALDLPNLQSFPVTVTDCFTKKKLQYNVCNVIGLIKCLDLTRSDIDWDIKKEKIFMLKRLALDGRAIERYIDPASGAKLKLFRLFERPRYLIAHSDVRDAVLNAGIKGIEFNPPEQSGDFL